MRREVRRTDIRASLLPFVRLCTSLDNYYYTITEMKVLDLAEHQR
jgi:hypothetical protein